MKKFIASEEEFEAAIRILSRTIHASVQKIHPQKLGMEPDDLVQEIKIKLWKIFKSEKKIAYHSSYIKKVIDSIIIDQIRASRRYEKTLEREKRMAVQDSASGHAPIETAEDINLALKELIESRGRVVKLFLLGLSTGEISSMLRMSESGARNLLYRGLQDLKSILRAKGETNDE